MSDLPHTPKGFDTVTAAMTIKNAAEAIEFYTKAFGAEEILRLTGPGGSVVHAEIKIGDSIIMIGEEWPGHHIQSPTSMKGTTCGIHIYVQDVDAGAKENMPPADMFWGDRYSSVTDPYGHAWSLGTHIKELSPEECQKACDEWMAQMAGGGEESS